MLILIFNGRDGFLFPSIFVVRRHGCNLIGIRESEGSRMANLWSDEQKSHQAVTKDKAATQVGVQ